MKKSLILVAMIFSLVVLHCETAWAQCSVCTRTASQLGEKPAKGLNLGILYLAATPLTIMGIMGYRWWRKNKAA